MTTTRTHSLLVLLLLLGIITDADWTVRRTSNGEQEQRYGTTSLDDTDTRAIQPTGAEAGRLTLTVIWLPRQRRSF